MKLKFKVGDMVRIRENSEFFGQQDDYGKIKSVGRWFTVEWKNGYSNAYTAKDLELKPTKINNWRDEL